MEKNKVIIIETSGKIHITEIDASLEAEQKVVGGYIDCIEIDNGIDMVIDDEGKIKEKDVNLVATQLFRETFTTDDFIVGDVFLIGVDYTTGEFISLTEEQIEKISNRI